MKTTKTISRALALTLFANAVPGMQHQASAAYLRPSERVMNVVVCKADNAKKEVSVNAMCGTLNGKQYRVFTDPTTGQVIEQVKENGHVTTYITDNMLFQKPCSITKASTGETLQALCGKKPDKNGYMTDYRIFNDNGKIIEQFERHGYVETLTEIPVAAPSQEESNQNLEANTGSPRNEETSSVTSEDSGMSTTEKYIVIGTAALATIGTIMGIRYALRPEAVTPSDNFRSRETYENRYGSSGRSANHSVRTTAVQTRLKKAPRSVYLDRKIPNASVGQQVRVAGAVPPPSDNTPVFYSRQDRYIIVENPRTNNLEALLIYDWINRPYYYGYDYGTTYTPHYSYSGDSIVATGGSHNTGPTTQFETRPYQNNEVERAVPNKSVAEETYTRSQSESWVDRDVSKVRVESDITTSVADSDYRVSSSSSSDSRVSESGSESRSSSWSSSSNDNTTRVDSDNGWSSSSSSSWSSSESSSSNSWSSSDSSSSSSYDSGSGW